MFHRLYAQISLDDAMSILYLKYGEAMEREMEIHFGKLLDEGAHFVTFVEPPSRMGELIDQQVPSGQAKQFCKKL
ncbi:hypothetical protein KRP22_011244 [Phytophthora ramorum]|nr:hypothetical protein KRP22_15292 [Phytophthora ramorum]